MVIGLTLGSVASGRVVKNGMLESEFRMCHNALGDDVDFHPSIALNGMMTMRLQRLHFSSKVRPLTLAMSWPH